MTKLSIAAAAAAAIMMAGAAHSAVVYTINNDICGCGATGTVTVAQEGANTVDVSVKFTAGSFNLAGGSKQHDAVAFDLSGITSLSFSDGVGTSTTPFFVPANPETAGSVAQDGAGDFQFVVSHTKGNNGGARIGTLNFDISAPGLTVSSFTANSKGNIFGLDVYGPTGSTGEEAVTGPGVPTVPEPATWALLMMGVGLVGGSLRSRRRALAAA
ncbi:MAG TPA: PEPxxWA-CTERM sorting domain-containing protein [Caulobacteraceae bacterium]|nr:PEPxxWA-CTERM sorting domain-containing protein [Caulobacteraceae bacterium]